MHFIEIYPVQPVFVPSKWLEKYLIKNIFFFLFSFRFWREWEWTMWCKTCQPCIGIIVVCRPAQLNFSTLRRRLAVTPITDFIFTGCAVPRNRTINNNFSCNSNNIMPILVVVVVVVIIIPTDCAVRNAPDVIAACPVPASRSIDPTKLTSWTRKLNRFLVFLLPPMILPMDEHHWNAPRLNRRVRPTRTKLSSSSTNNSNRIPELFGWAFVAEASTFTRLLLLFF